MTTPPRCVNGVHLPIVTVWHPRSKPPVAFEVVVECEHCHEHLEVYRDVSAFNLAPLVTRLTQHHHHGGTAA